MACLTVVASGSHIFHAIASEFQSNVCFFSLIPASFHLWLPQIKPNFISGHQIAFTSQVMHWQCIRWIGIHGATCPPVSLTTVASSIVTFVIWLWAVFFYQTWHILWLKKAYMAEASSFSSDIHQWQISKLYNLRAWVFYVKKLITLPDDLWGVGRYIVESKLTSLPF